MFKNSREKFERDSKAASKRFQETFLVSGDFICSGIEGYYSIYKVSANSGNRVTVNVSYDYDDVPWLKRGEFERDAKRLIEREYREYTIEQIDFYNRY